jgi:dihydroxyacetone kinase
MSKQLFNKQKDIVDESLAGLITSNPLLSLIKSQRVLYRSDIDSVKDSQVSIISGGGSGHEPLHVGFIGPGLLSAVVCGDVFASPSASQVFSAIKRVSTPKGVLLIVKNYTGDRLQFGKGIIVFFLTSAAERAKLELGIEVAMVIVSDDCSIPASKTRGVGRRGLAGTIFVHKVIRLVILVGCWSFCVDRGFSRSSRQSGRAG